MLPCRRGLCNICFLTPPPHPQPPHRNLLTLSIIPTTHKESFCSLSFSVSLYELQVILVQINKTQCYGEALLPEVLWILLRWSQRQRWRRWGWRRATRWSLLYMGNMNTHISLQMCVSFTSTASLILELATAWPDEVLICQTAVIIYISIYIYIHTLF